MQTLRTPDDRFTDLPEFPYPANYCDVSDGEGGTLRMAWVQDGPADADPVLTASGPSTPTPAATSTGKGVSSKPRGSTPNAGTPRPSPTAST